jgi:hypothetical protein
MNKDGVVDKKSGVDDTGGSGGGSKSERREEKEEEADEEEEEEEEEEENADEQQRGGKNSPLAPLYKFYYDRIKNGQIPSLKELQEFCRVNNLSNLCTVRQLRRLRYRWKATAVLSGWKSAAKYASSTIMKPGTLQIDLAYFMSKYQVANRGFKYFLVGCDILTGRLYAVPTRNKKRESWENAILEMARQNEGELAHLISDRDAAVTSPAFRLRLKKDYGISWSFLRSRSHAHRAERAIFFLKRRLSQALNLNPKGDNSWVRHLPSILREYNSRVVPGTLIPRDSVTKFNYMEVLEELRASTDPTMLWNISASSNFSPFLQKKLFKFRVGDRVLVARAADYESRGQETQKGGSFFKRSVEGSYAPTVRTVTKLWLKDSHFFLTPCYEVTGIIGKLYESELIPALFSKGDAWRAEDEEEEEEDDDDAKATKTQIASKEETQPSPPPPPTPPPQPRTTRLAEKRRLAAAASTTVSHAS